MDGPGQAALVSALARTILAIFEAEIGRNA